MKKVIKDSDKNESQFTQLTPNVVKELKYISTVNKNAYEIRLHVLELAVSLRHAIASPNYNSCQLFAADEILKTAREFYKFIENKQI